MDDLTQYEKELSTFMDAAGIRIGWRALKHDEVGCMMPGDKDVDAAEIVIPTNALISLIKVASLGVMAAKEAGIPIDGELGIMGRENVMGDDDDDNEQSGVVQTIMSIWDSGGECARDVQLGAMISAAISFQGHKHDGEKAMESLMAELDEIPTYDKS